MSEKDDALSSAMLEALQSPQLESILSSLKKSMEGSPAQSPPDAEPKENSLFSLSPELLAKLPSVMSALSSGGGMGTKTENPDEVTRSNRKALLKALKPYLNPSRQSMIETMLSLDGMSALLGIGRKEKD